MASAKRIISVGLAILLLLSVFSVAVLGQTDNSGGDERDAAPHPGYSVRADSMEKLEVDSISVFVNDQEINDGDPIPNYSSVKLNINWSLPSGSYNEGDKFYIDLSQTGIKFGNTEMNYALKEGDVVLGYYGIQDNNIVFQLTEAGAEFQGFTDGYFQVVGILNVEDVDDDQQHTITIDGKEVEIIVTPPSGGEFGEPWEGNEETLSKWGQPHSSRPNSIDWSVHYNYDQAYTIATEGFEEALQPDQLKDVMMIDKLSEGQVFDYANVFFMYTLPAEESGLPTYVGQYTLPIQNVFTRMFPEDSLYPDGDDDADMEQALRDYSVSIGKPVYAVSRDGRNSYFYLGDIVDVNAFLPKVSDFAQSASNVFIPALTNENITSLAEVWGKDGSKNEIDGRFPAYSIGIVSTVVDDNSAGKSYTNTAIVKYGDGGETTANSNSVTVEHLEGGANAIPKGSVLLTKKDEDAPHDVLPGAEFELWKLDAQGDPDKKIGNQRTDSDGKVYFTGLLDGDYQLIETQAPEGYDKDSLIIVDDGKFSISDQDTRGVSIHATNKKTAEEPEYDFRIQKVDASNDDAPMEHVEFKLYGPGGMLTSGSTERDGTLTLSLGTSALGSYTLKETTPEGYQEIGDITFDLAVVDGDVRVIITEGEEHVIVLQGEVDLIVKNTKEDEPESSYKFRIEKLDISNDDAPMENVEFKLYGPDGMLTSGSTERDGTLTLSLGTSVDGIYTLKETTPEGYQEIGDITFVLEAVDGNVRVIIIEGKEHARVLQGKLGLTVENKKKNEPESPGPGPDPGTEPPPGPGTEPPPGPNPEPTPDPGPKDPGGKDKDPGTDKPDEYNKTPERTIKVGEGIIIEEEDIPLAQELLTIIEEDIPLNTFDIPDTGTATNPYIALSALLLSAGAAACLGNMKRKDS